MSEKSPMIVNGRGSTEQRYAREVVKERGGYGRRSARGAKLIADAKRLAHRAERRNAKQDLR